MNYTADPLIKVGLRPDYSEAFNEMNNAIAGIATTSSSFWEANNNGIRYTNHIATGQATVDTAGTPVTQLNSTVSAIINNQGTFTNGSIALNATVVNAMLADPTANNASAWIGQDGVVEIKTGNNKNFTNLVAGDAGAIYHLGSGTINTANAMVGILENNSTGVMTDGVGIRSLILHSGSGAITSEYGVQILTLYLGSNPVTNHYGVRVTPPTNLGGTTTITNNYGIYIDDHTTLGTTLKYNLYSAGTTALHRIEGSLQVGDLTMTDAKNIILNTSTGTKIATATSQKLGFWNATPIVQPTTGVAAATFTANTSGIVNDSATFDGYTIGQVVKALRNVGILA